MTSGSRIALGFASVLVLGVAIWFLRDLTLSTHTRQAPDSRLGVVVDIDARNIETGQALQGMATAQIVSCALEVRGRPVGEVAPIQGDATRFGVTLQPALDDSDRRQFEGCIEDWRIDHIRVRVVSMTELEPARA